MKDGDGNTPDWSKRRKPKSHKEMMEDMDKANWKHFKQGTLKIIIHVLWKAASFVAMVYLAWCLWRYFDAGV